MERTGTVQVYTGYGKGKTTAALGQALRAVGHGQKVFMVQFLKGRPGLGEIEAAKSLPNFTILQFGSAHFVLNKPTQEDVDLARKGFQKAKEAVLSGQYDLVIMDEVNVAVNYKMLDVEEVLELIKNKPRQVELILTGRDAHPRVIEAADLVSEVKPIKHYYTKGVTAKPGVEY